MKMKNFQFSKYCTPAQLYLVLGGIGIITAFFNKFSIETLLTNALLLVIWAWVLNWLCSKGLKAISWILVLLPFIMALFTYFLAKDVVNVKEGIEYPIAKVKDNPVDPNETEREKQRRLNEQKAEQIKAQAIIDANILATQKKDEATILSKQPAEVKYTIPAVDNSVNPTLSKIVDIGTSLMGV